MGHRAIVLYEVGTGVYNAHYSHWGAHDLELASKLSRDQPWGGDKSEPEGFTQLVAAMTEAAGDDMTVAGEAVEATETTEVDPDPIARGITIEEAFEEVVDAVHHEAVFVVHPDRETGEFDVTGFRPISVALPGQPSTDDETEFLAFKPRWVGDEPVSLDRRRGIADGMKKTLAAFAGEDGTVSREDVADIWPELEALKAEADVGSVVAAAREAADGTESALFTWDAARLVFTRLFIADFESSLDEGITPYSTAATEELWEAYPESFLWNIHGRTRKLGSMHATGFDAEPWAYPDEFPFPNTV